MLTQKAEEVIFSSDDMHKGDVSRNGKENSPCIKEDEDDYGDHFSSF